MSGHVQAKAEYVRMWCCHVVCAVPAPCVCCAVCVLCPHRCEQLLELMSHTSGLTIEAVTDYYISLGIAVCVSASRQQGQDGE